MITAILTAVALTAAQLTPAAGPLSPPVGQLSQAAGQRWVVQPTPDAVLPNGKLVADSCSGPAQCLAVGSFSTSSGTSPLAEAWNGTAWRVLVPPVPAGASHGVLTSVSCTGASACVAVGHDTSDSGSEVALAETWNGTSWTAQAPPDPPAARRSLLLGVSCATATSCVAIGYYIRRLNQPAALAESWNGTAWTLHRVAISGAAYSALYGVSCPTSSACTAVGRYLDSSSDDWVTLAARWNGRAWTAQATPNPGTAIVSSLYAVSCPTATACTAVGDYINVNGTGGPLGDTLAEAWNGSAWAIQPTPDPAGITEIAALSGVSCASAQACSAVGYYNPTTRTRTATLAETWNGSAWAIQPTTDPGGYADDLSGLSCASPDACLAVGHDRNREGASMTLAELGNDVSWATEPTPSPPGAVPSTLDSVSCPAATACTAVGFSTDGSVTAALALGWNGAGWSVQPAADRAGASHNQLSSVSCATADACIAVGEGGRGPLAEAWNGSAWTIQHLPRLPGVGNDLKAVSCVTADACTAVGYYTATSGQEVPLAERWDGTTWSVQPVPVVTGGYDYDLAGVSCSSVTACTAVGTYDSAGSSVALAERWNGTAWQVQATPAGDDILYGVSCGSATACIAVGNSYTFPGPGGNIGPLAEAWNGSVWRLQVVQDPAGFSFTSFYGVSCRSALACVAVGGYDGDLGVSVPLAESWNGTAWTTQPTTGFGDRGSVLAAVSARPSAVSARPPGGPAHPPGGPAHPPGGPASGFTAVGSRADAARVSRTLAEATR